MHATPLYPLRFEPLYQYRLWGGRRLGRLLSETLPGNEPIGEAWLLSDRDDFASRVADGPLKGKTIAEITAQSPEELLGNLSWRFKRFPLLLKMLDVKEPLSVQVHPSEKTEAWVVLENGPGAHIFAGLKAGTTAHRMRRALADGTLADELAQFTPQPGDAVLIRAGTVHSLADVVVFELQQNSDVTFRLYDWDHIDPKTSQPRPLQVEQAIACIDFEQGAVTPLTPRTLERRPVLREKLIQCEQFAATRISGRLPFVVGKAETPRILVCLAGSGHLEYAGETYEFGRGQVLLSPAVVGACLCRPHGSLSLLEISLPERH
ncbi:MAG TPA: type I phosphomannose isomerase catalytic subunit [Steroidobacteraceae bacterium]|jgi:mannose-6-phosphate isomerase|nr:type I phosphomannose isomerase catalytic subunit [Steroidobacteraceae bacterium]